jgi:uncharacterized membrane protein YesL
MSGRFIAQVVAAIGWLVACLIVYAVVSLFGFFGVGFFGLLILFICTQVELESDAGARLFAPRAQARQNMPRAERASRRYEQTTGIKTTHFVRSVGIGLTLIGFGGFLYFQLGLFDP